jgi:hypothetical protein
MVTYQSRISGPFLDRIDLQIDIPAVTAADLALRDAVGALRDAVDLLGRGCWTVLCDYPASGAAQARLRRDDAGRLVAARFELYRDGIGWQNEVTDDPLTADRFWWFGEHELIDLIPTD